MNKFINLAQEFKANNYKHITIYTGGHQGIGGYEILSIDNCKKLIYLQGYSGYSHIIDATKICAMSYKAE